MNTHRFDHISRAHWIVVLSCMTLGCAVERPLATKSPTTQPDDDPRAGLITYFDAVRRGDEAAAFGCWLNDFQDISKSDYDVEQVHLSIRDSIADAKFDLALLERFPADADTRQELIRDNPDAARIASAQYTQCRRLAIVRWSDDENAAFPMVLDNGDSKHHIWKISMQQYRETTRSSVGDSILESGWFIKATQLTTSDIRGGKIKTARAAHDALMKHLLDIANSASTQPAEK